MRFWIDIESAAGAQLGEGPIVTAQFWESNNPLDRCGRFSFSLPAHSARADLCQTKRIARCYTSINNVVTLVGAGVIDKVAVKTGRDGKMRLDVSGDTIGRLLTYRQVGALAIDDGADGPDVTGPADIIATAPAGWSLDTDRGFNATFKSIQHTFESETTLAAFVRLAEITGEHFYITAAKKVVWIRRAGSVKLTHGGVTAGPFTAGETVTGGTSGATATFRQTGAGNDWIYAEDASGRFVAGETVTGGTSGASIVVTVAYNPYLTLRAVQGGDGPSLDSETGLCIVDSVEREEDSYDLVTRVYPHGVGDGDAQIDLSTSTWTKTGYTIDTTNNYIKRDAAEVSYGQIDRSISWKDIADADTLAETTYEYLVEHSYPYFAYKVNLSKLDTALLPGEYLHIIYHRWIDQSYHAVNIDAQLVVLETRDRIDNRGFRTVGVKVANLPRWPISDAVMLVNKVKTARDSYTYEQPKGSAGINTGAAYTWTGDHDFQATTDLGSATNYTRFANDGTQTMAGTARVRREIQVSELFSELGGSAPTRTTRAVGASGGVVVPVLSFSDVVQNDVYFEIHAAHDTDDSVSVEFHIHWIPNSTWTSGNYMWKLEYLAKANNASFATGTPTTISADVTPANATDSIETEFASTIDLNAEQTLCGHFYRDVANDNGDAKGEIRFFEIEYTSNKLGVDT